MSTPASGDVPVVRAGAATDTGRVRAHNEDAGIAEDGVYVVADGMGGHAAGEVASAIAVTTMRELAGRGELTDADVRRQVALADERIHAAVEEDGRREGMGTTLTGLVRVVQDGAPRWAVLNVGDSRVYRWADGVLTRATIDHSEVQELLDAGAITPAEARTHPMRNVITRSLGVRRDVQTDIWVVPVVRDERFVICSDGLTGELTDEEIAEVMADEVDPQVAAEVLVRRAVAAGGRDNVTVVVVSVGG